MCVAGRSAWSQYRHQGWLLVPMAVFPIIRHTSPVVFLATPAAAWVKPAPEYNLPAAKSLTHHEVVTIDFANEEIVGTRACLPSIPTYREIIDAPGSGPAIPGEAVTPFSLYRSEA